MSQDFLHLATVSVVVAIDNALLTGVLLPRLPRRDAFYLVLVIAVTLSVCQVGFAMGVGHLLENLSFRVLATVVLAWMAIRTLNVMRKPDMRSAVSLWVAVRVFLFTAIGNLDNMILLGTEVGHHQDWLAFFSIATIPLFIVVALFLAAEAARYTWVPVLGAGMMAWAAGALCLGMPARSAIAAAPWWVVQGGVAVGILLVGWLYGWVMARRVHSGAPM